MSRLESGDIVLVSFPFTDFSKTKLRPAVIISSDDVHQHEGDYTLLFISSVIPAQLAPYEVLLKKTDTDFKRSGLKRDSVFKAHKLVTVEKRLIKRRLGRLGPELKTSLQAAFRNAMFIAD